MAGSEYIVYKMPLGYQAESAAGEKCDARTEALLNLRLSNVLIRFK